MRIEDSADLLDVQLLHNKHVELPAEHEYTRVLLALKHLVEAPVEQTPASVQPATSVVTDSPPSSGKKGAKSDAS
ncbi:MULTISPECIES: hypothetical protein [Pseudomonas]|uniref:hypothetical protein n=1 Tax=Pseudomonas TaxID=286 RepID=UPI001C61212D|nr:MULTISPECIES: hypothetical protein [Pseudomonas]MDH0796241.1 hypothetical protein [Pseudomonas carnis]